MAASGSCSSPYCLGNLIWSSVHSSISQKCAQSLPTLYHFKGAPWGQIGQSSAMLHRPQVWASLPIPASIHGCPRASRPPVLLEAGLDSEVPFSTMTPGKEMEADWVSWNWACWVTLYLTSLILRKACHIYPDLGSRWPGRWVTFVFPCD